MVFLDGIWDFFLNRLSRIGLFLVLYGSEQFLTSPTVQCLCKMVLVLVMLHFSSSFIFLSSSLILTEQCLCSVHEGEVPFI